MSGVIARANEVETRAPGANCSKIKGFISFPRRTSERFCPSLAKRAQVVPAATTVKKTCYPAHDKNMLHGILEKVQLPYPSAATHMPRTQPIPRGRAMKVIKQEGIVLCFGPQDTTTRIYLQKHFAAQVHGQNRRLPRSYGPEKTSTNEVSGGAPSLPPPWPPRPWPLR